MMYKLYQITQFCYVPCYRGLVRKDAGLSTNNTQIRSTISEKFVRQMYTYDEFHTYNVEIIS